MAVVEGIVMVAAESIGGLAGEGIAVFVAETTEGIRFAAGREMEVDGQAEVLLSGMALTALGRTAEVTAEVTAAMDTAAQLVEEGIGRGVVEQGRDTAVTLHCCCP